MHLTDTFTYGVTTALFGLFYRGIRLWSRGAPHNTRRPEIGQGLGHAIDVEKSFSRLHGDTLQICLHKLYVTLPHLLISKTPNWFPGETSNPASYSKTHVRTSPTPKASDGNISFRIALLLHNQCSIPSTRRTDLFTVC